MSGHDTLLSHDYDGIKEYDNNLPLWWLGLFWLTIFFSAGYVLYYHYGPGPSAEQVLALQVEIAEKERLARMPQTAEPASVEQALLKLASNTEALAAGKQVYDTRCLACHAAQGQGLVGPNLTDDFWIHGGKITDVKRIVEEGVLAKGMLAWKALLSERELDSVVAYRWSLHGSNPPNPKAPEGAHVPR
ncbi:MAG TPA: cbb3-type cytochrome c oxidase N-terminal domain-containing protein [Oligoflexia bacterium]|nr:cbb3-type cytochrome c oxidase N-terminal domain-containing protein [Oligoflexia bacterium]